MSPGPKDQLMAAIRKGQADKVKALIEGAKGNNKVSAEQRLHADMEADSAQNAVLHRAARWGHHKVVKVNII